MLSQRILKIWLSLVMLWFMSCINTSYSRFDEVEITSNELDLILGQFAHHGEVFYGNEVTRTKALLLQDERDFVARNDLASAYIKLKQYDGAVEEFDENEEIHPGRYETAANRGVLYKKMGEYELAAGYINDSLNIKEEGHMGLGDYYLRMIQWLDNVEKDPMHDRNFLGVEYIAGAKATSENSLVNKEYLLTLIKNDFEFADVYIVLGDVFLEEGEHQLALRCFYRAEYLKHPVEVLVQTRLERIKNELELLKKEGELVEYLHDTELQVVEEMVAAEKWLVEYQQIEASLLDEGRAVDFKSMKEELRLRGVAKPKVIEAMIYEGEVVDENKSVLNSYLIDGGVLTIGIIVVLSILILMLLDRIFKSRKK